MTLFEVYKNSIKKLKNPDAEEINIRILLCENNCLKTMSDFYLHKDEDIQDLPRYQLHFKRYLKGEPIQYILSKASFYARDFFVDKRVLIPRQESEEVVDFAIIKSREIFGNLFLNIADICCGSGIMGITLASKLNYKQLFLSDISKDAIDVAKINSSNLPIKPIFYCADCLDEFIKNDIKIDLLISNPPYILKNEFVDKSVLDYEPHLALFSDSQFSIYKNIIDNLFKIKNDKLLAVFEIGDQTRNVLEQYILEKYSDIEYGFKKDMNGKERIFYIILK